MRCKKSNVSLLSGCISLDFKNILVYHLKCCFFSVICDIKMLGFRWLYIPFCVNFKNNFKKVVSTILSISILYTQLFFSILIAQATINSISYFLKENNSQLSISNFQLAQSAHAYDAIIPPKNIEDNPINHIEVDNSIGNGNTHLDRAQNGTPVININAPSAGGVSANYYKDFNVNNENLIFNNYQGEAGVSQLGGALHGNPNLNKAGAKEADIILNEVTTNRISKIEGYVEIFGKKADLIIANPNGIMVSGGGFINTARLSLITGSSNASGTLDTNGGLNPFLLSKDPNAIITVAGVNVYDKSGKQIAYNLGIDAKNVDYVDLISRVVQINGSIYGSDTTEVNIKTGNNTAEYYKDKGFQVNSTSTTETESTKPTFAIDSYAMGGIYAGRININATEDGVGVSNRSDLVATADDINFDVNGNIFLDSTGSLHAKNNINITNTNQKKPTDSSQRIITNNSILVSENNINISTNKLTNTNTETIDLIDTDTDLVIGTADIQTSLIYAKNDINIMEE